MDTKALREEFATLHAQAGAVLTAASEAKRDLTPEEGEANKKRFARMDSIKQMVDDAKRLAEFSLQNGEAELPRTPKGREEFEQERSGKVKFDPDAYRAAVNYFARTGSMEKVQQFAEAQKFAITSGTATGAYLPKEVLPPVNVRRLPNAVRQLLSFYGVVPISRSFTESISLPCEDETAVNGQQQSEGATSGTSADADTDGSMNLLPVLYSSKQKWYSNTVVLAQDWDVFSYALPALTKRLDKVQESSWIAHLKSDGTVGRTTTTNAAISYVDWLAFEHSLAAAYRPDAGFIISDSAYQLVRGLTDNNGRPILDLDPANNFMATIHGKPVIVSDYFDQVAPSGVVCAFASADAIKVFDAGFRRIARYILDPNHPDQTGFELFANGDFDFIDGGVKLLKMHA